MSWKSLNQISFNFLVILLVTSIITPAREIYGYKLPGVSGVNEMLKVNNETLGQNVNAKLDIKSNLLTDQNNSPRVGEVPSEIESVNQNKPLVRSNSNTGKTEVSSTQNVKEVNKNETDSNGKSGQNKEELVNNKEVTSTNITKDNIDINVQIDQDLMSGNEMVSKSDQMNNSKSNNEIGETASENNASVKQDGLSSLKTENKSEVMLNSTHNINKNMEGIKSSALSEDENSKNKGNEISDQVKVEQVPSTNVTKGSSDTDTVNNQNEMNLRKDQTMINKSSDGVLGKATSDENIGNATSDENIGKATSDENIGKATSEENKTSNTILKNANPEKSENLKDDNSKTDSKTTKVIKTPTSKETNKKIQDNSSAEVIKKINGNKVTVPENLNQLRSNKSTSPEKKVKVKPENSKNNQSVEIIENSSVTTTSTSPISNMDDLGLLSVKTSGADELLEDENINNDEDPPIPDTNPGAVPGDKSGDDEPPKILNKEPTTKSPEIYIDEKDSHFFAYFVTGILVFAIGYLVVHNKQKILGLIVEGRTSRARRRSHVYKRLENEGAKFSQIF